MPASGKPGDRGAVEVALRHWQADADFARARDRAQATSPAQKKSNTK
jgi:hypothetical protein